MCIRDRGYNGNGQLGLGSTASKGDNPNEMGDNLPALALGQPAVDVSAGNNHACAVLLDGTLKCWGHNSYGQLGLGDASTRTSPTTVGLGTGMVARDVEAGTDETCVIMVSGQVKCWGRDYRGVLGNPGSGNYADYFGNQAGETADALPFIDFGPNRTAVSLSLDSYTACATTRSPAHASSSPFCETLGTYFLPSRSAAIIFSSSSLKPMSSIWSASSSTANFNCDNCKTCFSIRSIVRPGVPTTTSTPRLRASQDGP